MFGLGQGGSSVALPRVGGGTRRVLIVDLALQPLVAASRRAIVYVELSPKSDFIAAIPATLDSCVIGPPASLWPCNGFRS